MDRTVAQQTARIVIADDHDLFADSLRFTLDLSGFDTARAVVSSKEETTAEILDFRPDVALIDYNLGDELRGTDLLDPLRAHGIAPVVVTAITDLARMAECLEAGAVSVVSKSQPLDVLVHAVTQAITFQSINSVAERDAMVAALRSERLNQQRRLEPFARLTPAEAEVLQAMIDGLTAEGIAERRVVSIRTVRSQIEAILAKLEVHSQLTAVALAHQANWSRQERFGAERQ